MVKSVKLVASAAILLVGIHPADACTGVYVGRAVSEDGTTMICRTVDNWTMACWHYGAVVPHRVSESAIVYRGCWGFERAWPKETYRYVCTPRARQFRSGRMVSLAMNEMGVAITGTVTAWPKRSLIEGDPFLKTGATEESVPEYLIACSASAREAVDNLAAIMRENGNAEGNIYMFADQREAWYVETYSGHEWCAVRMPEDRMAAFGNEFMLGEVNPGADGVLVSPGLYPLIDRTGSAVRGPNGRIHLAASCGARLIDFSNMRTWWGRRYFAPGSVGEYATDVRHEAFFKPSGKVSKADVFAFFRSRFEGTDLCPETNHLDYIKFVGTENQVNEHVLSIRSDVPARFAATSWTSLGPADHSVFFPIPSAIDRFEPEFGTDSPDGAEWGAKNEFSAANAIRRLATLARIDRVRYGEGIRDYWRELETRYLREWPEVQAKAFSAGDRAKTAAILSEYSRACQREVDKAAKGLFGDLVQYMVTDIRTVHWHPSADGYGIEPIPRNPPFRPVRREVK